jgi:phenylalanyl-tRNA synthetase beta chain
MRLSWSWLSEVVDLAGVDPAEAARLLTFRTAEVEGVERLGAGLAGVVTARVDLVEPHPGADRLRLCTVSYGAAAPLRVVCGASNVAAGQVVCFAKPGTTLPNGMTLEKRKIRGVESGGMICAEDEMGLGKDHEGIVVLPAGTPIGRPVAEALGASDVVFEVSRTAITNRPDLWGHVGFARELSAILERPMRPPSVERARAALGAARGEPYPVAIEDEAACRRYVAVVVEGLQNGPSPAPVRRRLEALGLRSVDRIVDWTNLVLLETGQPLHAFDLRDVEREGGRVRVRRAAPGERLRTLDGVERALHADDLVIAGASRPLAIAGVMGGEGSGVRADTTAVLLESACFDAGRIRRTATRHGLRTDASARFEKSLDPEGAWTAALRFLEHALASAPHAKVSRPPTDVYPRPYPAVSIDLRPDLVRRRLGLPVPDAEISRRLVSLGFGVEPGKDLLRVRVPSWRATKDVSIPEDLVEEVGRLHGYEHVVPVPAPSTLAPASVAPSRLLEREGKAVLTHALGYAEITSRSFYGPKECERAGLDPDVHLRVQNPLSADQDRLIVTTVPNLLAAAVRNQPSFRSQRLSEWARVIAKGGTEVRVVGLLAFERSLADGDGRGSLFLGVVSDVRTLLDRTGIAPVAVESGGGAPLAPGLPPPPFLHPGRTAVVRRGERVLAYAGELAPSVARAFGVEGRVAVAEIDLDAALAGGRLDSEYRLVPRFPVVPFDVAVIVPRRTAAASVAETIRGAAPAAVRDVECFDSYEGAGIPEGSRSLAFRMSLVDEQGTLSPKASEALRKKVVDALTKRGFTVRTAATPAS